MKKQILMLIGLLFATGIIQAARSVEEQERLDKEMFMALAIGNVNVFSCPFSKGFVSILSMGANPNLTVKRRSLKTGVINNIPLLMDIMVHISIVKQNNDEGYALDLKQIAEAIIRFEGTNKNATDTFGSTPLHMAVTIKDLDLIICLLENGANPTIRNNENQTPLDLAIAENASDEIKQQLQNNRYSRVLTFTQARHDRLGERSSARVLPKELFERICRHYL